MRSSVSVTIVTYNSRRFIARCLESLAAQTVAPAEVVVVDNGSDDGTQDALKSISFPVRLVLNRENQGFAAGQNQAIAHTTGDWVLTLNPDVLLGPTFLEKLMESAAVDDRVGTICGKLLRLNPDLSIPAEPRLDSAGIFFTPNLRHFDRGWNEADGPGFERIEYVFGASGAAALYKREMIDEISCTDGFFDPDFFAYREDADVAWRAQLLGWRALYTPAAVGYHVRRVTPENRKSLPPALNRHSVKNRFLLRIKNITTGVYRQNWWSATLRDALVVGGCLLSEHSSLPAFTDVVRMSRKAWGKRRWIMARRQAPDEDLIRWFSFEPASRPLGCFSTPGQPEGPRTTGQVAVAAQKNS
ncbi:MAG: glycosyltransferase family 2 protein [Acidobacteria bacterium]|nr:glycosyltransferase family 2 protein [Acidobacteriota bacterium]